MNDLFAEYIDSCRHKFEEFENKLGKEWVKCKICGVVAKKEAGVD